MNLPYMSLEKISTRSFRVVLISLLLTAGADVKKLEQSATKYLKRVMDEHPDTPWALLARREKDASLGLEWRAIKN